MRYQPSQREKQEVESYNEKDRLHFFLTRVVESEEVWGLSNDHGWILKEQNGHSILPVWPYESFASNCILEEWRGYTPGAVSLEHFIYRLLPLISEQNIQLEILPTASQPGGLVDANKLNELLESMLESGEYYLEG
ncbi:MAG: DUF2750 domain-containing protein [Gammaproteobacteria bacterium]|jgi:hypothetical protein